MDGFSIAGFSQLDLVIFLGYLLIMVGIGIWISVRGKQDSSQDYFLASKALPWWAVGGSLIASNISAEQFIGMSGSGYAIGMAIAAYELLAAITLILVAKFFLPVFIHKGIYTMPQFLEERYDGRVRSILAVFWIMLIVFVNISSVLYLGAIALKTVMGIPILIGIIGLGLYAATFSIFGGLKGVVWTDVIQVVVLIFGGLLASVLVLTELGGSVWGGWQMLLEKAPEKFDMLFTKDIFYYDSGERMGDMISHTGAPIEGLKSAFDLLPGISILIGGMWIVNTYYWGTNQYIIQRALAAKSLKEAQIGTAFAALIKMILPIIVVVPGIAAYVLGADLDKADEAYPWVLKNYVTVGFKGLAFAALIAAIGSSLSSMGNSASTIFSLDIYKNFFLPKQARQADLDAREADNPTLSDQQEKRLVLVGKIAAAVALVIGAIMAPLLGNLDQIFQFIQEYTGYVSPGVLAVFVLGMFWKKNTANAALVSVIVSVPLSLAINAFAPGMPFIDRMGVVFLVSIAIMVIISRIENKGADDPKGIKYPSGLFKTSAAFNVIAFTILSLLAAIYALNA